MPVADGWLCRPHDGRGAHLTSGEMHELSLSSYARAPINRGCKPVEREVCRCFAARMGPHSCAAPNGARPWHGMADIVPEALTFVGVSATALPSSHSLLVCSALAQPSPQCRPDTSGCSVAIAAGTLTAACTGPVGVADPGGTAPLHTDQASPPWQSAAAEMLSGLRKGT